MPCFSVALSFVCKTPCEHRELWGQCAVCGYKVHLQAPRDSAFLSAVGGFADEGSPKEMPLFPIGDISYIHFHWHRELPSLFHRCILKQRLTEQSSWHLSAFPAQLCCPSRGCGHLQGQNTTALVALGPHSLCSPCFTCTNAVC